MPNTVKLELNGKEHELFFSCAAMNRIADRCDGDLNNISKKLDDMKEAQAMAFMCGILADLANGAVIKHNCDVILGLESGEKKPEYPEDYFAAVVSVADSEKITSAIFEAMGLGSEFNIPDNVKVEEKDIDLAEIEAEKESKKF